MSVGRLIKGVIYNDVDMNAIKQDMFDLIDDKLSLEAAASTDDSLFVAVKEQLNLTDENLKDYSNTLDAIAALTRLNFKTGVTHNLIIPKETLSNSLVKALEPVDLAKDLISDYVYKFESEHSTEPVDSLPQVESNVNGRTYKVEGKEVSEEEFYNIIHQNPEVGNAIETLMRIFPEGKGKTLYQRREKIGRKKGFRNLVEFQRLYRFR